MDYRTKKHLDNLESIGTSTSNGSPEDDRALQDARSHLMIYGRRKKTRDDESGPVPFGGLVLLAIGLGLYFNPGGTITIILYFGFLFLLMISLAVWPMFLLKGPEVAGPALTSVVIFALLFRNADFAQTKPLWLLHWYSGDTPADGFLALLLVGMTLVLWLPLIARIFPERWSDSFLSFIQRGPLSRAVTAAMAPVSVILALLTWQILTDTELTASALLSYNFFNLPALAYLGCAIIGFIGFFRRGEASISSFDEWASQYRGMDEED